MTIQLNPGIRVNVTRDHQGQVSVVEQQKKPEMSKASAEMKQHKELKQVPPPSTPPPPIVSHPLEPLLEKWYEADQVAHNDLSVQLEHVREDLQSLKRGLSVLDGSGAGGAGGTRSYTTRTTTNQEEDKEEEEHLSMGPGTEPNPYNHTNGELKEAAATVPSPLPSQPQQKQSWFDGRTSKTRHPLIVGLIGEVEESMRLLKLRRDRIE